MSKIKNTEPKIPAFKKTITFNHFGFENDEFISIKKFVKENDIEAIIYNEWYKQFKNEPKRKK